jgi:phosphopantothenoylcysteine decarboxylase/phosphopantothenate--cysteine ligase
VIDPAEGEMACGEYRSRPPARAAAIIEWLSRDHSEVTLAGKHILVTAGPTHEPIDPVRVIANRSSGRQGFAIAARRAEAGARVTLVAGPVALETPPGVERSMSKTAEQMADAVMAALPADAASWSRGRRLAGRASPTSSRRAMARQARVRADARHPRRAGRKRAAAAPARRLRRRDRTRGRAGDRQAGQASADWIVANDVSGDVMGGHRNRVHLVTARWSRGLARSGKDEVARELIARVAQKR